MKIYNEILYYLKISILYLTVLEVGTTPHTNNVDNSVVGGKWQLHFFPDDQAPGHFTGATFGNLCENILCLICFPGVYF